MSVIAPLRPSRRIGFLALVGLVVAGCRGQAPTLMVPTPLTSLPTVEARPPQPTGIIAAPTETLWAPSGTPRPVRTELEATDPGTVSLANGTPTMVEFFAFW